MRYRSSWLKHVHPGKTVGKSSGLLPIVEDNRIRRLTEVLDVLAIDLPKDWRRAHSAAE
jgi:hypothetical protein